jgi:single-stranded-DNA-specific exonuclease
VSPDGPPRTESRLRPPEPLWSSPEPPPPDEVAALMRALGLPETVCAVLVARGLGDPEAAKRFLRPSLDQLHAAELLADGPRAAERIASAVRTGETILVHGDYDVDGICATALLTRVLRGYGAEVVPFVPHRLRDGYDFGEAGLSAAREAGAGLILTADCGTVAFEIVGDARAAGIDVVITDHHTVADTLPAAFAVVNPQRADCPYPDKDLCGTGVAYKMASLVAAALGEDPEPLRDYLDFVALATVADLVPLRGENRVFVSFGLRRFPRTRVPGIAALLGVAGVEAAEVTAGRLGFVVAPRINAAGRIGDSADALRLLLTEDVGEARDLARQLDEINRARQDEDQRTLAEALELLERSYDPASDYGVVLAGEGWHPGVIGIVASRVVERIHRPVVLLALDGDRARGSARSIPGFDLYAALDRASAHMLRFGGHKQAAGMDVSRDEIPRMRAAFNDAAREELSERDLRPTLRTDLDLTLDEVDLQLIHWLDYLGPHGIGNPGPVFVARGVTLDKPKTVGRGHLKVGLRDGRARLDGIGFGLAERHPPHTLADRAFDVAFRMERNEWRGAVRPQARILGLRPSGPGT